MASGLAFLAWLLICSMVTVSFGSATNARFISPDTLNPTTPGVGTNRYAYSDNDPVNKSDPNGHFFGVDDGLIGLAIAIGAALFAGTKEANAPGPNDHISNTSDAQQITNMALGAAGGTLAGKVARDALDGTNEKKQVVETENTPTPSTQNQNTGLGDLTAQEVEDIQKVVDEAGRPIDVVGSAAKGARRSPGENLPYGKGPGEKSDIDYITRPAYFDYYKGIDGKLPELDPKHGIVPGAHNPYEGPAIHFEPGSPPRFIPRQ